MPEIKNQFTGGKMNKDIDERLVPKGEYRDAMNIQVSTSEGSEVGTVQNILGNIKGCSYELIPPSSFTVGSVADEKNDTLYWLVSGQYNGVGTVDWNQFSSVSDMIIRKTPKKCEWVFVDQYAFTTTNNTSNNFGSVNQISGLTAEISNQIEPGWTVTGLTDGGDTSNTVDIVSVTPSPNYTANQNFHPNIYGSKFIVPLDSSSTMQAGNVLYVADYDPLISMGTYDGMSIRLFQNNHPDDQMNTVATGGAQLVTFTKTIYFQNQPSVSSTYTYLKLTLAANMTVFAQNGNFDSITYDSGDTLSRTYDGSIIWGQIDFQLVPHNWVYHAVPSALQPGDPINFGSSSGCVGYVNNSTLFTMVDCSTIGNTVPTPIQLPSFGFSFTLPLQTTVLLNTNLNLNTVFPLHESLIFEKPRVLNFDHGDYITGINIIDDMLFWTDGKTEPKKINIPRSVEGTQDLSVDANGLWSAEHTRLMVEGVDKGSVKEEHITVIRKAPLQPPHLEIKSTAGEGLTSGENVITTNSSAPFSDASVGELVTLDFADVPDEPFGFIVGDTMLLSHDIDDLPDNWKIRVSIESITSSGGTSTFVVKIEAMASLFDSLAVEWYGYLEQKPSIFQRKLPRFAYRYKYEDGEYSSFSPFTEVAFMPSAFDYEGTEAYNKGVINSIKSLKIQNFVTPDMPLDVIGIDLLYKDEINPSVYLLKSVSPNDKRLRGETQNHWNTPGSSPTTNGSKGSYEVSSDNITLALPSSQSLRVWDNVPKKALAQEITGNRVVYGNYTQGYETVQPDINVWLGSRNIDTDANVGKKSIKSLRDYNIGVVWGDKYGRETPVKTSGSLGSIKVPKSRSINSNYINVDLRRSPDWAEYYRVYVKETSNEYYNLPADRVYDAADGNVWVSFPSVDRNKVDEDTYIILKKGPESEEMITEEARYKIVAIENEAPEYIKTTFERLVRTSTDGSKGDHSCDLYGGTNSSGNPCGFPSGANAPLPGRKGFSIFGDLWSENDHETVFISGSQQLGMQLTSPKVLFDDVIQNDSGSTTDELYVSFAKEEPDADGNMVPRYTERYHVVSVEDKEITQTGGLGYYYINLDQPITSKDSFITDVLDLMSDNIHIHFWKKTIINKPEFDGRFFVKIKSDTTIKNNLISTPSVTNDLMVINSFSLYKIAENSIGDYQPSNNDKYLFHTSNNTENAPSSVSTCTKYQWENLLKFGGSTMRAGWFIDNATFASQQKPHGNAPLPSSGKLSFGNVSTTITDGNSRVSCDMSSEQSGEFVSGLRYPPYLFGGSELSQIVVSSSIPLLTYLSSMVGTKFHGDGLSNGQVAMRGVDQWNGNKYIDLGYSQFGPNHHSADGKTTNYNLDWRIGVDGNSSTDQENVVVGNLQPETLFRVNGSNVVYKILGVNKFRLFNYHGAKRSRVTKIPANAIPFHGTHWSTRHSSRVKEMGKKQNRRVTYRIQYEVSEIYSPDAYAAGDALDTAGQPIAGIVANSSSNEMIQFLTEFSVDGENPISTNPAIFETEPKDDVDIDIYYEASSSLATLPLTNKNKHLFIPIGSTIIPPINTDFPEGIFITSWETINPFSPLYVINLSAPLENSDFLTLLLEPTIYIEKDTGEIVSCKVDAAFTVDPVSGAALSLQIIPKKEIGLNWFNCWSFNNGVESNRIGDTYNKPYIANGATASSSTEELKEEETRKNGLIYSGIYNSTSGVNNLNQFIAAEKITKDISPIYGSIQKLYAGWGQGGDLVTLCEDRILKILANKDALYNADGNTNVTSTNNVLGQAIPYSGEYGISRNPESFASEAYRIYFTDKVRGAVVRLSMDGLTPISNYGMKDWFRDHLKLSDKLIGSYDDKKDEYNITLSMHEGSTTVTFREDIKGWVSFKSFTPENAISCANEYFTFMNGVLWQHHAETPRNTFYGVHSSKDYSTFTAILNDIPGSVKSFNTINYEGSNSRVVPNLTDDQYYNLSSKPGWYVQGVETDKESGAIDEFMEKEGKWFNYIKGENVQHSGNNIIVSPDGSSTFDHSSFAIQGIGRSIGPPINVAIQGCMDSTAFNFEPSATQDDGSCEPYIYGCLHPSADNYDSNANTDSGNCTWTGCTCLPVIDFPNGCINTTTFPMEAVNYPLPTIMPIIPPFPGISDDGSCVGIIYGCTDQTAVNYNPAANTYDGSCISANNGCMASTAVNYDSSANADNGTCIWYGCQDPAANNFYADIELPDFVSQADGYSPANSNHGLLDATCTYDSGCTDSTANNYDATATIDDGSCEYCGNITQPIPTPDPNNASTLTNTYFTASVVSDETTSGANDGVINIDISATSPYGDNSVPTLTHSNGVSYTNVMVVGTVYVFSSLPSGTYDLNITQGTNSYIGNQTDPCLVSFNALLTVNPGPTTALGCTDATANNYDASANIDDGSCTYDVLGCTDSTADNYDPNATSDDGSCAYTLQIGDTYQGGIIAYFFQLGDTGYVAGEQHGIIAAPTENFTSPDWGCSGVDVTGLSDAIGAGQDNTNTLVAQGCINNTHAADLANDYNDGTYADWFLPSIDELEKIIGGIGNTGVNNLPYGTTNSNGDTVAGIGNFNGTGYWSSSQSTSLPLILAQTMIATNGTVSDSFKNSNEYWRAARYF